MKVRVWMGEVLKHVTLLSVTNVRSNVTDLLQIQIQCSFFVSLLFHTDSVFAHSSTHTCVTSNIKLFCEHEI